MGESKKEKQKKSNKSNSIFDETCVRVLEVFQNVDGNIDELKGLLTIMESAEYEEQITQELEIIIELLEEVQGNYQVISELFNAKNEEK